MKDDIHSDSVESAEILALRALSFIASDPYRLSDFQAATGITIDDLKQRAADRNVLAAALSALMRDESALLMFAANAALSPERIGTALRTIEGHAGDDAIRE